MLPALHRGCCLVMHQLAPFWPCCRSMHVTGCSCMSKGAGGVRQLPEPAGPLGREGAVKEVGVQG